MSTERWYHCVRQYRWMQAGTGCVKLLKKGDIGAVNRDNRSGNIGPCNCSALVAGVCYKLHGAIVAERSSGATTVLGVSARPKGGQVARSVIVCWIEL
jgi:hypothetical protein